jgi:hypothetical protein
MSYLFARGSEEADSISGQIYIPNGIANMHENIVPTIVLARSGDFSVY